MKKANTIILTKETVLQVSKLANLSLSADELEKMQKQLAVVVGYIDQLKEVDTKGVEPTSQVTGLENVARSDEVATSLTQKDALSGTPNSHEAYFKVKSIFE